MHSSMLLQLPTAIGGTATARGMQQVQHFQASQIGCHAMHMRPSCPLNASQAARPSSAQMMCVAGPCATFVSQPLRCSSMQQSSAGDGTSGASRSGGAMCSHVRGWGSWQRGGRSRGGPATASDDDDFALQLSTSSGAYDELTKHLQRHILGRCRRSQHSAKMCRCFCCSRLFRLARFGRPESS